MWVEPVVAASQVAVHDTQQAGGNLAVLFVFVGVLATAGWVMFSPLEWRNTIIVTVTGWAAGLVVAFVF